MLTLGIFQGSVRVSEAMVQVNINGNTMNAARQAAKRKETVEFRDTGCRGLAIRVKGGTAYWWAITVDRKVQISAMDVFKPDQIELLRALVPKVKLAWKEGRDPAHLITEVVGGGEHNLEKAEHKAGVRAGEWTWKELRDGYLRSLIERGMTTQNRNDRSFLGAADPNGPIAGDFADIVDMPLKSITHVHLAAVIAKVLARGRAKEGATADTGYTQAKNTHAAIRAAFKWGTNATNSPRTGISVNIARLVEVPARPKADASSARAKATFTPLLATPKQLQAFGFKWLWADDTKGDRRVKRALQLQMLTGQRVASVLRAHRIEFVRTPGRPWRYVWALGPDKMGAYRLLPLPEVASYVVHESLGYERKDETNPFLFPQLRKGKGKEKADGHFSYSTAKTILIRASDKGGPLPESFKGTHDLRRGFTTILSDWKKLGFHDRGSVEAVTHFNEGRESVSQSIYNYDERLAEKFKVLSTYQDLILYADRNGKRIRDHDKYWELDEVEDLSQHSEAELRELYAHMDADYEPMDGDEEEDD